MKFKDVVIKNFIWNVKQYFSFFLCSAFSITIFFMYATLIFNEELTHGDMVDFFAYVIPITVVGISLFSVFFIIYANSAFIKGRNKELGIYMTLGLSNQEIKRLVNLETAIISGGSLLFGILVGALFSRIFQMGILKLLDIQNVSYYLDYKAFVLTIVCFGIVFGIVIFRNARRMKKMDINSLLKESRVSEGTEVKRSDGILGIVGLLGMALSIGILRILTNNESIRTNPVALLSYMAVLFGGVYLVISRGGNAFVWMMKKRSSYTRNMLAITQIHYKYNQNKRILFILSVLSTMTIVFVASPFSLFSLTESIAEMNPNDVEYVESATVNHLEQQEKRTILEKEGLLEQTEVGFIYLYKEKGAQALQDSIPVLPLSAYEKEMNTSFDLAEGQCINIVVNWMPGNEGMDPGSTVKLYGETKEYSLQVAKAGHEEYFAGMSFPSNAVLLVTDEEYAQIWKENQTQLGSYQMMQYENWKDTKDIVETLEERFAGSEGPVMSTYRTYVDLKNGYATFLFVFSIMGVLFFIAGGSVLYFRQYTELPQTKATFYKLFKIGITTKEVKQTVGKELRVIFFVPLVFGAFAGASIIVLLTNMFSGADVLREFMRNTMKVIVFYFVSQGIFYIITKNKYVRELKQE